MPTIEAQLNGEPVVLEIGEATVLTAMKRSILRGRAQAEVSDLRSADSLSSVTVTSLMFLAAFAYPDCLAATVNAEGIDLEGLTVQAFAQLPESFVDAWLLGVYQACPHWEPRAPASDEEEAAEKKD